MSAILYSALLNCWWYLFLMLSQLKPKVQYSKANKNVIQINGKGGMTDLKLELNAFLHWCFPCLEL